MYSLIAETQWAQLRDFSLLCGACACLVYVMDSAYCKLTRQKSLIGIIYNQTNWVVLLVLWTFGAAILGFVGAFGEFLQPTKQTVVAIGLAWPLLLTKILKRASDREPDGDSDEE